MANLKSGVNGCNHLCAVTGFASRYLLPVALVSRKSLGVFLPQLDEILVFSLNFVKCEM